MKAKRCSKTDVETLSPEYFKDEIINTLHFDKLKIIVLDEVNILRKKN